MPYGEDMTETGQNFHREFKSRIVGPYRDSDFWYEALKRLAVVRESVNEQVWQQLMGDLSLPDGVASLSEAWEEVLRTPWIRPRANRRYVTLHDAVAEELTQRIIPLHDQDKHWRRELWRHAVGIYRELTEVYAEDLAELAGLEEMQQPWDALLLTEGMRRPSAVWDEGRLIRESTQLDARRREYCQLRAARLYYEILCDFTAGCRHFLSLFEQAKDENDILFQELLAFEMQRFLPGTANPYAFGDVIGDVIGDFRAWMTGDGHELYLEVGLSMADYLISNEQPNAAFVLLHMLPDDISDHRQRYHLSNLRGNACMRIPGHVKDSLAYFLQVLEEARQIESPDQLKMVAAAYKELGFYYRYEGLWELADDAYRQASDAIEGTLSARSSEEDRAEMASIQTNWAYVKGLIGAYREGTNLVESAISVRRRLGKLQEEGISWSVCGEIYRYQGRFEKAWQAYAEAEQIFQGQRNWSWLGMVYQEQAICLFQATQDNVTLISGRDPIDQAKRLITLALDLCRDLAVRGHPSALNRAGRIFAEEDADAGLGYLVDGIEWAHRLSDGWFWFANLIEYVDLSYRSWVKTGYRAYRDQIAARATEIDQVTAEYEFPYLKGRWMLLQGHLCVRDWLETMHGTELSAALGHYMEGFALIAQWCRGSSGAAAVAREFETFTELARLLPPETRSEWQDELRGAWCVLEIGSTSLLARLDELH
jgi:tetratricopeptide (TPR) repeat protein